MSQSRTLTASLDLSVPNRNKPQSLGLDKPNSIDCSNCGTRLDVRDFAAFDAILCPHCTQGMMVPGRLGPYMLVEKLGEGAMGRVYRAIDDDLHREVAIKVLRKKYGSNPQMWQLLEEEARSAATLNHPNVVEVYSLSRYNHRPYLVMELVRGDPMEKWIKAERTDVDTVLEAGLGILHALRVAKSVKMIHGDIKPANILILEKSNRIKVVDFGMARFVTGDEDARMRGTPYYLAPEKISGGREDFRSDMYSLGATLFHILAGSPPFDGDNAEDVLKTAIEAPTPRLSSIAVEGKHTVIELIYGMMQKEPEQRYRDYETAIAAFEAVLAGRDLPSKKGVKKCNPVVAWIKRNW